MTMKKTFLFLYTAGSALLLTSCANSERLTRMSGGVITEYSAPKQYRLRSEKFQAKSRALSSDKKISHGEISGLDNTLVNIWPFFFASNNYWCALWPMIDCDPYGFAVRPFFNKEGDDCSVLFPLSSWNSRSKSGWFANFVWEPNAFGFIPLTWQSKCDIKSNYYYTPLFILEQNRRKLTYDSSKRTDRSFFCCFAYGAKTTSAVTLDSPHHWLFSCYDTGETFRNEWLYRYRNGGAPGEMPKNKKEIKKLKEELFKQHKVNIKNTFGVFPLFHTTCSGNGYREWVAGPLLAGYEQDKTMLHWYILGSLGTDFRYQKNPALYSSRWKTQNVKETTSLVIPPLLTRYKLELRYTGKRYQLFERFKENSYQESFSEALPRLQNILKEISPGAEFPKEVTDWNTFHLFKAELAAKENFSTEEHKTIFAGPLFYSHLTPQKSSWIVPILLSWGEKNKEKNRFTSLPLLSFIKEEKNKGYTCIMPPLAYWSNFERKKQLEKPVYAGDCKWSGEYGVVEEINQYALLGLFYRGRHAFSAVKGGFDHKKTEFVRKNLLDLGRDYQNFKAQENSVAKRQREAEAWKTENKIEYYQKLIRFEELKNERERLAGNRKKYDSLRQQLISKAAELGVKLVEADFCNRAAAEKAAEKLLKHTTVLRWKEDIGSGIFFRKENFYNGDYNWHFCHILAGGKKEGNKESTHILHLLYRKRKEASRTETIVFPFISHVKDGKNRRTSFLWRVFSIGERNGKTGGHILFIPFGEKI